ncbi:hypothetical protein [Vibrio sinaloensis]|uniref:hypothetical protein n=1 Tax=Photobacterium sp. (strain ATCC 43367) TaxID=379097 RepID=UPI00057F5E3E|nr:hypothetical protein [Vibrio sinaloensis]KHT44059.1 hypothetical protein RJ47_11910 [Vibrio sinaloensis]
MQTKLLTLAVMLPILGGCASISLTPANGNGALLIGSDVQNNGGHHPCRKVVVSLYEMISGGEYSETPIELEFMPKQNENYYVFSDIKPGYYVAKNMRCYSQAGRYFNDGEQFLDDSQSFGETVEANKITVMQYSYYGRKYNDGSFSAYLTYDKPDLKETGILAELESDPNFAGWGIRD